MGRLRIALLFGGASEERAVSVKSAQQVAKSLDVDKYEPIYVGITSRGEWRLCNGPDSDLEAGGCHRAILSPDRFTQGLLVQQQDRYHPVPVDLVFPLLHGKHGEDGAIQGLLQLSGVSYVGCDVQSSALCMDKSLTYLVARHAGVRTPQFRTVIADDVVDPDELTYPAFVKPARSGSSFGVCKVTRGEELPSAIDTARRYDTKVLIEAAVVGSEVGCAVIGNGADLIVGEPDRVALSHGFFRIHQERRPESGSENATFIVPADISPASRELVQMTARTLYQALGCRGLSRVDLFLLEDGTVVLNEVNTMPGLTSYSRFPRMMAAAGWSLAEVIDRIVALALSES
jgi:D-alanine---(R)-lactate ligase